MIRGRFTIIDAARAANTSPGCIRRYIKIGVIPEPANRDFRQKIIAAAHHRT